MGNCVSNKNVKDDYEFEDDQHHLWTINSFLKHHAVGRGGFGRVWKVTLKKHRGAKK